MSTWDGTTWVAIGAAILAVLALGAVGALLARLRLGRTAAADRAWEEVRRERAASEQARDELRWLRHLGEVSATEPLESVLRRALEAAAGLAHAAAAMIVLPQAEGEPLVATVGLSAGESAQELLGLPPPGVEARATTLRYRYEETGRERDEFRLSGGIAVPVPGRSGGRVGTLTVFWRRADREATEDELARLEGLAAALGPALAAALSFESMRRELDIDPATGLRSRRSLERALEREYARARRYEHPLGLLVLRVGAPLADEDLRAAGGLLRGSVRRPDVVCHLGEGRFAALLPEASRADAERLARRLEPDLAGRIGGGARIRVACAATELGPKDDATSLLARAESELAAAGAPAGGAGSARTAVERGG
ncbi:MAG TPA: diguanylate cyclase [Gaiellaceae bacterium]|nr:diguanylate cyclase [Gaiellaceae bacterium]